MIDLKLPPNPAGPASKTRDTAITPTALGWFIRLRWWEITSQLPIVIGINLLVTDKVPNRPLLVLIILSAFSNLLLGAYVQSALPRHRSLVGTVMVLDTFMLTALLYWSGGPSNPFSIVYLVHITLAAVVLKAAWIWTIVVLSDLGFGLLFFFHHDLPGLLGHHTNSASFSLHLQGMWVGFALVSAMIAYFVGRVARELRARELELLSTRELASRNARLASLTTLAAGAAHELSTPLATIAVVARELEMNLARRPDSFAQVEDARLIRGEVQRCRAILDEMGARATESVTQAPEEISLFALFSLVRQRLAVHAIHDVKLSSDIKEPLRLPVQALVQVLVALLKNAREASPTAAPVSLTIELEPDSLRFTVIDSGTGMSENVLEHLGEPFFTTKPAGQGMGLGLFLVQHFADRMSGRLTVAPNTESGTKVTLTLPYLASNSSPSAAGDPNA